MYRTSTGHNVCPLCKLFKLAHMHEMHPSVCVCACACQCGVCQCAYINLYISASTHCTPICHLASVRQINFEDALVSACKERTRHYFHPVLFCKQERGGERGGRNKRRILSNSSLIEAILNMV